MIVLAVALGFVTGCAFTFAVVVVLAAREPWERDR